MHQNSKIVIIGAGHVGSHCALSLALRNTCDEIVLVDKLPEKAAAQAMDVADALSFPASPVLVKSGDYRDCLDADIIVVAIGQPRLPGQTRLDLLYDSTRMADELIESLKDIPIRGILISITNPADIIANHLRKGLNLDRHRAFGTGTLLDTARLLRTLSEELSVDRSSITAFSMGEHGDSSMIAFSQVKIGGLPLLDLYPDIDLKKILDKTRNIGMDIINGKGSTEFGIGQSLAMLAETILRDKKTILPVSVALEGEYGQQGLHCGVPCLIGAGGIEHILELPMTADEREQFNHSCDVIKEHIQKVEKQ